MSESRTAADHTAPKALGLTRWVQLAFMAFGLLAPHALHLH